MNDICLNCFKKKGAFDVCPRCGFVEGSPPEQAYHLYPGTTLSGRYIIGTVTGFGGFGTIYKAWDTQLGALVAIKEFYPAGLVSRVPGEKEIIIFSGEKRDSYLLAKSRFLSEARNLAMFNKDPNIVNVYSFFEENNTAYIVMEYLDGVSLRDYLAQTDGKLPVDDALEIVKPIIDALIAIHAKGIVHRDIHPGNIFLTANKKIKLLDFGAARLSTGEDESTLTVIVTQGYASPEQYRTKSKQGPFTDIYGLGATLYKMVTGILPDEALDRQVKDTLKKPSELGIAVTDNQDRAIMKALALKPDIRFQKTVDLKTALFEGNKVDFPEIEFQKKRRRRTVLIAALIVVLAGVVTTAGLYGTVLRPTSTFENTNIERDTIRVWLPVSDDEAVGGLQTAAFDEIVQGFLSDETVQGYLSGDARLNVEVESVPASEYAGKIAAAADGGMPTLFMADALPEDARVRGGFMAPLDLLLNSLNVKKDYLFLDSYAEYFPSKNMMPTGFHAAVVYANEVAVADAGLVLPEEIAEMPQLFAAPAWVGQNALPEYLSLFGAVSVSGGKIQLGAPLAEAIRQMGEAYDALGAESLPLEALAEGGVQYFVGGTADLRDVQSALPGYYRVIGLTDAGRAAGGFDDLWSVSADAPQNQQNIAMLFIAFLLNDFSQDQLYLQQDRALPLTKTVFEDYISLNADFGFLKESVSDMTMDGEGGPALRAFADGIFADVVPKNLSPEEIESWLRDFDGLDAS
jgi:serine/threonine protein kinase